MGHLLRGWPGSIAVRQILVDLSDNADLWTFVTDIGLVSPEAVPLVAHLLCKRGFR